MNAYELLAPLLLDRGELLVGDLDAFGVGTRVESGVDLQAHVGGCAGDGLWGTMERKSALSVGKFAAAGYGGRMPVEFLSDAEAAAFGRFDGTPSRDELDRVFFWMTPIGS